MTNRAIHARRRAATPPRPKTAHSTHLRPTPLVLAVHLALVGGTMMASGWSTAAHAQDTGTAASSAEAAPKRYDIPAGPLGTVLARFAGASGVLLAGASELVQGRNSPGLSGTYTLDAAIKALLAGSELEAVRQANGSYALRQAAEQPAPAPATPPRPLVEAVLPVVTVKAGAEQESAWGPVAGYVAKRSTTGTKTDTPVNEVPQSISVVTRDSMDARAVSSVSQALEYAPGFTPHTYGQDERYNEGLARGVIAGQINFRDELKERGGEYAQPKLNTYGVERVEFLRGPASILFGSIPPGGMINAITKRPTDMAQGEVRLRAGNFDRQGIAADLSGPLDEQGVLLYRLVASTEQRDLATPYTTNRENYFAPALTIKPNADTQLTLLANYQQTRLDGDAYPYSIYYPVAPYYISTQEKGWDRFYQDQWSTSLLLDHRLSDSLSFHSRTRYGKTKLDYRLTYANAFLTDTIVERGVQYIKDKGSAWHTDNYMEAKWGSPGWANTTIVGVDFSRVTGDLKRADGLTTPYDVTTNQGIGSFVEPALAQDIEIKDRQAGWYVQNQSKINDRYVVLAGLRHDNFRAEGSRPSHHNKLTGRIGGVWLLPFGFSPYVSYSTSFEPMSGATYDGSPFKPTEGRQYEIGVRYEPVGTNARFSAALFDIKQQNVLATDPEHQDFNIQRGEVGSRGLELEANMSLSSRLDLTASYTYTDARITKDTDTSIIGRQNAFTSRHAANAWLDYRFPATFIEGQFNVGVGARYNSRTIGPDYATWMPGNTFVDLRLGYTLDRWELSINARNLFDRKWLIQCSNDSCYPGAQREVIATARYRW